MIYDDGDPTANRKVSPDDEPRTYTVPLDGDTLNAILEVARDNEDLGPLAIHETLVENGYEIDEPTINYVLEKYDMDGRGL